MYSLLIVDDEPLTREYMKMNVPSIHESWTVAGEAEDGSDALAFMESRPVDLVITDIRMPVMDGLELCKSISMKYPGQKIVILSGYDEFAYAREAMLYGVTEYLLKPVVRENLRAALDNVARKLEREKNGELAYKSLINLSKDSSVHIVGKLLQALVTESNVEIKTLLPLIHRMKISLLDGQGVISMLSLDEENLLLKNLPAGDISIYRYILNQAASEIAEESGCGRIFLDSDGNTCLLCTGDDIDGIIQSCCRFISHVSSFMNEHTSLTITASIGSPVNDLLQLGQSYKEARKLLLCSLVTAGSEGNIYRSGLSPQKLKLADGMTACFARLKAGFLNDDEVGCSLALSDLSVILGDPGPKTVLRCGIFLIRELSTLKTGISPEQGEDALRFLKVSVPASPDAQAPSAEIVPGVPKEIVLRVFKDLVSFLLGNIKPEASAGRKGPDNAEDLIGRAKEYIYLHYAEPISLPLIAENLGVSPGYLSQQFHKTTRESYIQFLTRVRMEQAAKLLKACPGENMASISERVGYMGVKHFSYVFKQFFGTSPGEYQNSQQI